jgi:tungstate transport system permease protein
LSTLEEGIRLAFELLLNLDPTVLSIAARSVYVSSLGTILASAWSIPIATAVGLGRFRGRTLIKSVFNTFIGIPAVALGLILYLLLSRVGPLGAFQLLYTNDAIIIGQALLISPLMISLTISAIETVDPAITRLSYTLGATRTQMAVTALSEAAPGVSQAALTSFNRAIGELGVALMVGGNIRGATRILSTAIALETTAGEIALGIALTIILLMIVASISIATNLAMRGR